jgi:hypothetical protein
MIFEDSTSLFNSTELDFIKSSWKDDKAEKRNYKDRTYYYNVLYDLPQEYLDRFLDWIENKIGKNIDNRKKYHLILHRFKKGDYFDYHTDGGYRDKELGKREYAAGFHLNNDYEGGEFVVYENEKERVIGKQIGAPYIFSADIGHKINKVKSNTRYSIVVFVYNNSIDKKTFI